MIATLLAPISHLFPVSSRVAPERQRQGAVSRSKSRVCVFFYPAVETTSPSLLTTDNTLERSFFIRMKSTLTKRGVHIKSSGYKVSWVWGGDTFMPRQLTLSFPTALGPYNEHVGPRSPAISLPQQRHLDRFRRCWRAKCPSLCLFLKPLVSNRPSASAPVEIHAAGKEVHIPLHPAGEGPRVAAMRTPPSIMFPLK